MTTEVSAKWLDRIVVAHQRGADANARLFKLKQLLKADELGSGQFSHDASDILNRDGTHYRYGALNARLAELTRVLGEAERTGSSVGGILHGLTEVIDAADETILNTEALLAESGPIEDPFIDRLEEHPAYERS